MIVTNQPTTAHYKQLVIVLGEEFVNTTVESPFDFIRLASKGISVNILKNFKEYFEVSIEQISEYLDTSEPTLYRWMSQDKILDDKYAVKIFEITDMFLFGCEVFGTKENFFQWLELANQALGGMRPAELIGIPGGISKVKDVIGRIQYGVYS